MTDYSDLVEKKIKEIVSEFIKGLDDDDEEQNKQIAELLTSACRQPCLDLVKTVAKPAKQSGGAIKRATKRSTTAYNQFIKDMFAKQKVIDKEKKAKGEPIDNSMSYMTIFSRMWKDLPSEEKQSYQQIANDINEENGVSSPKEKSTSSRGLNAYNMYIRENSDLIKSEMEDGETLMGRASIMWGGLSADKKKEYATMAKEFNDSK